MIKITSGIYKNRNIACSNTFLHVNGIRPTSNYTKQLVMNLIKNNPTIESYFQLNNSIVCDVCCGSGAMGFEFLSSGASKCFFIDSNFDVTENVKKTAKNIDILDKIIVANSMTALRKFQPKVDMIFIDPPYQDQDMVLKNFLSIAMKSACVSKNTIIIIESFRSVLDILKNVDILIERKSSSDTVVTIVKMQKEDAHDNIYN